MGFIGIYHVDHDDFIRQLEEDQIAHDDVQDECKRIQQLAELEDDNDDDNLI